MAHGLLLPATNHKGASIMLDPEVQDIVDKLHYGCPTLGWEGDERLALYRTADGAWELDRLGEDGVMYTVCRSRPGVTLDNRLIMRLVEHDSRRRDAEGIESVIKHNEALEEKRTAEAVEALHEPMDKMRHALVKANPGL